MIRENWGLPRLEILSVARGAGIVFFGTIAGTGFKYVFQVLVARRLGAGLFGLFVLGLTVFTIAEIIAQLGLPQGLVRFVSLFRGQSDRPRLKGVILFSARSVICSGTAVGAGLFFGADILAFRVFGQPDLAPVIRIFAVMTPFSVLGTILLAAFQGFQALEYKIYVGELTEPFLRIIAVLIVFRVWGKTLPGTLWAYGSVAVIALLPAVAFLKKIFPEFFRRDLRPVYETRRLIAFSWPLLFSYVLGQLLIVTDSFVLGILGTSEDVGIYGAAQRTGLLASIIFISFNAIFAPISADLYSRKEHGNLEHLFKIVSKWTFSFTLPVSLLLILLARPILYIFGERFVQGAGALAVLAGGWLVHSAMGNAGAVLTMSGRSKWHLLNLSLLVALVMGFNILLIPRYGIMGAASGTAGALILVDIITCLEVYGILHLHPFRFDELKPLLAGGVSWIVSKLLMGHIFTDYRRFVQLPVLASIFLLVYTAVFILLRIGREEKLVLGKLWERLRH